MSFNVCLTGGAPWGFRLQGGKEFGQPLRIAKINPGSKALHSGLKIGDIVESINGDKTQGLMHNEALKIIKSAPNTLELGLRKEESALPNGEINGLSQTYSPASPQLETELGAPFRREYQPAPLGGVPTTMTSSVGTVESSQPAGQDSPPLSPSIVSAFAVARELKQKTARVPTLAHYETVTAEHHDTLPQSPTRPSRGMNIFMKQQSRLNKEEAGQLQGQLSSSNQPDQCAEPGLKAPPPPPPVRQKPVQSLLSPSRPSPPVGAPPSKAPPPATGSTVKVAPPVPKKTVSSAGVKKTPFYFDTFESQRSFVIDQGIHTPGMNLEKHDV